MKRTIAILFGTVVLLVLAVGCSDSPRQFNPHFCDEECEAKLQADREYITKNFPTREQALQVRECATARTGYDEFPEMPADFGPPSLTDVPGTPVPANRFEEDMPFRLVEKVLVAVGQRKPLRERVDGALNDCIYDIGLEDRYIPPWDQDTFRPRNS